MKLQEFVQKLTALCVNTLCLCIKIHGCVYFANILVHACAVSPRLATQTPMILSKSVRDPRNSCELCNPGRVFFRSVFFTY